MNKKLKIYNIIRIIVDIVFVICMFIPLFKYIDCVATSFMNLFDGNFVLYMIGTTGSALLIYYILKTCAVIWHEVGHLIYGLKAKLEFISFVEVLTISLVLLVLSFSTSFICSTCPSKDFLVRSTISL
jgi:hypothetical protein